MYNYILISILFISCSFTQENKEVQQQSSTKNDIEVSAIEDSIVEDSVNSRVAIEDPLSSLTNAEIQQNYYRLKKTAKAQRYTFYKKFKMDSSYIDTAKNYLFNQLVHSFFPSWNTTTWDFNGYSAIPRKGEIACGYFVSTNLLHVGFNLNRYELAKKYSHDVAFIMSDTTKTYFDLDVLIEDVKKKEDNIYIIGLDNHVGYLIKEGSEVYFHHSAYSGEVHVKKEYADESSALASSTKYVVAELLSEFNILNWLKSVKYI